MPLVRVRDAQSPVEKLEYALAGGPWQLVYPTDGVADSQDERFDIPIANEADIDRIMLRATDRLQNVVSGSAGRR